MNIRTSTLLQQCDPEEENESISDIITRTARDQFGLPALFPFQRLVISNILEGCGYYGTTAAEESYHHQIVILPTGAGKSLCFMLPGALISGITLIVFPLLSLIADQARRLREVGLSAGVLTGSQSTEERSKFWRQAAAGSYRFILTNPEILAQEDITKRMEALPITHGVVDEAHTLSEWGTTFRPTYLALGQALIDIKIPQITAFTATAAPHALKHIRKFLFHRNHAHLIRANPDRPNISYLVIPSLCRMHDAQRLTHPESGMARPLIIFCATRSDTVRIAAELRLRHRDERIRYYHAGLDKEIRKKNEAWFFSSQDGILCSTTAYGMGVDKANIRSVIHYGLSSSPEAYLQETGRAGRDRKAAEAVILLSTESLVSGSESIPSKLPNENRMKHFLTLKGPEQDQAAEIDERRLKLTKIFSNPATCRRESLLQCLDAEPEVCFGCDVCDGTVRELADGEFEIIFLIRHHQLKFTPSEAADILFGRRSLDVQRNFLYRYAGFGALRDWELEDIETAIYSLTCAGILQKGRYGPWKGLLRLKGYPLSRADRKAGSFLETVRASAAPMS